MHYANGREAKVGDLVVGTAYNTRADPADEKSPRRVLVGALTKAHPGVDRCNAEIEWTEVTEVPVFVNDFFAQRNQWSKTGIRPNMAQGDPRVVGTSGALKLHWTCRDYTHVGALLHVEDVVAIETLASDGSDKPFGKATFPAADHPAAADQA